MSVSEPHPYADEIAILTRYSRVPVTTQPDGFGWILRAVLRNGARLSARTQAEDPSWTVGKDFLVCIDSPAGDPIAWLDVSGFTDALDIVDALSSATAARLNEGLPPEQRLYPIVLEAHTVMETNEGEHLLITSERPGIERLTIVEDFEALRVGAPRTAFDLTAEQWLRLRAALDARFGTEAEARS